MKKDRLDKMLRDALSHEDEIIRDVGQDGLIRLKSRLTTDAEPVTRLDVMLNAALRKGEATVPEAVADAAMRRLRNRLEAQRPRRWAPAFRPALAVIPLAIIAAVLIILQIIPAVSPVTITAGDADTGVFAQVVRTRSDILAQLPRSIKAGGTAAAPQIAEEYNLPLESRRLSMLDDFSTKACGESFARRIGGNRRTIIASLQKNRGGLAVKSSNGIAPGDVSPAPSRHVIMLNERLDNAGFGF